jgi:hypothetical protein
VLRQSEVELLEAQWIAQLGSWVADLRRAAELTTRLFA